MMPTYKTKQSGTFVTGVTKVMAPSPDIVIGRNEANSGQVSTSLQTQQAVPGFGWHELKNRTTNYNISGGVNANSSSIVTLSSGYFFLLTMSFSEFDLASISGIDPVNITGAKLRYTLTSNTVTANRPTTFSVYSDNYTTLSSSTWRVVTTTTEALGTASISTPATLTRDITISKALLTGSTFRIVTIHDLLREYEPSENYPGVDANIASGSPELIVSGNFGSTFIPVNIGVL